MIVVTSLRDAPRQALIHGATHVVGVLSPDSEHPTFERVKGNNHLCLSFHDVALPTSGMAGPQSTDLTRLLGFLENWNGQSPLLIHCWAGISRSTASAYIATCLLRPQIDEMQLALELREASPSATPNPLLIALADAALGRDGRMQKAIANIGRGSDAFEGVPFQLKI